MAERKEDIGNTTFTIGIVSIVLSIFQPIAGLVLGIIGINLAKGKTGILVTKGRKYSQIAIVISIIVLIITIIAAILLSDSSGVIQNFPIN